MPTTITGTDGVSQVQAGAVESGDLASGAIGSVDLPAGSVIQVVQFTTPGGSTFSNDDWVEMMSQSITPQFSSSKIFIQYQMGVGNESNDPMIARIRRDSTVIGSHDDDAGGEVRYGNMTAGMFSEFSDFDRIHNIQGNFLDSPSTTNTIVYKLDVSPRSGSGNKSWRLGRHFNSSTGDYSMFVLNTITLMEIKG